MHLCGDTRGCLSLGARAGAAQARGTDRDGRPGRGGPPDPTPADCGTGVAFRCTTVNVKNDEDEALLAALESDVVKGGLQLLETAQPALGIVSTLALALTKTLAKRRRNVAVQEFSMGLDLGGVGTGARLRAGTYFVVQVPDEVAAAGWNEWAYNRQSGLLVQRPHPNKPFPYNHVAFGVRRHGGA